MVQFFSKFCIEKDDFVQVAKAPCALRLFYSTIPQGGKKEKHEKKASPLGVQLNFFLNGKDQPISQYDSFHVSPVVASYCPEISQYKLE